MLFRRRSQRRPFHEPIPKVLDEQHVGERVVEVERTMRSGALVPAPYQTSAELLAAGHMISPAFMVDKPGPTTRKLMVFNQKRMNREMRKKSTKLDDLRMLRSLAQKGDFASSMDVGAAPAGRDGYHAVEIHVKDQRYMTVDLGDSVR